LTAILRVPSVLLLAVVGLCSCSLLTSVDGLTSGALPPSSEGGADASSDAPGAVDGGASDAEAGPSLDGGLNCAMLSPAPKLCVDFGQGRVHAAGLKTATDFEAQSTAGAPQPRLDSSQATSPPASALFELSDSNKVSYLLRTFDGPAAARIELSASLRVDGVGSSDMDLMELRFGDIDAAVFLQRYGEKLSILEAYGTDGGSDTLGIPLLVTLPFGRWMRVGLVLVTGASPTLTVSVDGTMVVDRRALVPFKSSGVLTIIAGCTDSVPSGTVKLWYDDVVANF